MPSPGLRRLIHHGMRGWMQGFLKAFSVLNRSPRKRLPVRWALMAGSVVEAGGNNYTGKRRSGCSACLPPGLQVFLTPA